MINAADNQVWRCTVALQAQFIGIMKVARDIGQAIDSSHIAIVGEIILAIAGAAIVRGDRLQVGGATGRLSPFNQIAAHSHTVGTLGDLLPGGAPIMVVAFTDGAGNVPRRSVSAFQQAGFAANTTIGGTTSTITTSSNGAITNGVVVAKALESEAVVGNLVKVLIIA